MSIQGPGAPGAWQPPAAQPTTQPLVFASVGKRFVAYFIDGIILAVIGMIVLTVLSSIGLAPYTTRLTTNLAVTIDINWVGIILYLVIAEAISAAYFVYMWTTQRATLGMRVLSLQLGMAGSGTTLTQDQAIRRWAYLALPGALVTVFANGGAIGMLVVLAVMIYYIALLVTTYQSPTRQGLHDQWANTVVVGPASPTGSALW